MASFRNSASFGKRMEYTAIAELLRRNYDVYMTLVDDMQIDCIIRFDHDPPRYIDIQIKARSRTAKNPGTFAAMEIRKPRDDFFFIFYSEAANHYWVMPSKEIAKQASVSKSGRSIGRYKIDFTNTNSKGEVRPRPKWNGYLDRFELLGVPVMPLSATT